MDFNNYSGNNPRFAGQPQNQPYPGGMSYYPQQGFPNQRPPMQQNMQFGFPPHQQPQGFPGRFGQGQFPRNPNPQMQQAFDQQQYQKMMEQQQKMAQENEKLNNETRKKRDFEMQQKRLQELRHGGGKKGGGDLSHLIGTLAEKGGGTKPAPKQHLASSTGKSLFSRPGGFYQAPQKQDNHEQQQQQHDQQQHYQQQPQHLQPQPNMQHHLGQSEGMQQFSGQQHLQHFPGHSHMQPQPAQPSFPQHHGQPNLQQIPGQSNVQQQPGQSGFSQHPVQPYSQHNSGMQNQQSGFNGNLSANPGTGPDDDFSDFQEAPSLSNQGSAFPSQQGAFPDQGSAFPSKQGTFPGQGSAFPGQRSSFLEQGGSSLAPSSFSNVVSNQSGPSWPNHSQNNPSWQMRPVATSTMDVGFTSNHMVPGTSTVSSVTTIAQATPAITGPRARTDSQSSVSSSSSGGFLSSQPGHFGQSQYQPSLPGIQGTSFMAQGLAPTVMPGIPGQEQMKQMEQHGDVPGHVVPGSDGDDASQGEPEDPVKKLYGVDMPEWCTTGKDLPGVYKDVKDAVTMNGAIDTGKLHTLLLTSELHRDILGQLWSRVNKVTPGQLNDMELRMMLGLIALGQTGLKVERLTLEKLATCKSAPIPSFPEDVFKSEERSWSFQNEPDKEEKESKSSLPVSHSLVGWQNQPGGNYSSTTDPSDKYSVFRMDNTSTSIASATTKETTGSFSSGSWFSAENSHSNLNQDVSRGTQMLGQFDQANKLSTSPDFQGFQSAVSHSEAESNDFGDFQGSVSSLDSAGGTLQQSGLSGTSRESGFDITSKLTASLEDLKLKSDTQQQGACEFSKFESFSFTETVTTSKSSIPGHSSSSRGDGSHGNKPNAFASFPSIKIPPEAEIKSRSTTSKSFTTSAKPENKVESGWETTTTFSGSKIGGQDNSQTAVDKYSFLKNLDSFSAEDTSMQPSRKKDDSFGDFESFEKAAHPEGDDFGDFHTTTTESVPGNQNLGPKQSQGWGFEGRSSIQPPKVGTNFANFKNAQLQEGTSASPSNASSTTHLQDNFGDFGDFHSSTSTLPSGQTHENDMPSLFPLNANFNQDMNGQVKNGFVVDQSRQRSSSTTSNSFTNTIPLDSIQRYKMLSDEGEDMEKHDNVWGRCLNSCLLTLVTGALAVQKMSDPGLKQEVLMSKKGVEYFTALKEVFWVTQRIQVSLIKTEFGNDKLKNILLEINQSWKNISNFLGGSNIETNTSSECLTEHHIQADEDKTMACGVCLLNVNKSTSSGTDTKISYGGRDYHATCANFWCNRVDSILPKLLPVNSLI